MTDERKAEILEELMKMKKEVSDYVYKELENVKWSIKKLEEINELTEELMPNSDIN